MTADKDRMVKAMNEVAELQRLRGFAGEVRKMLPLLEANRSTVAVAKRLRHLMGEQ